MGANLNTVFVVDVESTCWDTKEEQGNQPNEVIEIGICSIDIKSGKVSDPASYIINPQFTKVSPFCTELTGWTQADIEAGANMRTTLAAIAADYGMTRHHVWFSCGEYDRIKLSSYERGGVGELYGIPAEENPFDMMRSHINIKTLFALKHALKREIGMAAMLKMMNAQLEGRHHNGADDAWNIAKIVKYVLS